MPIDPLKLVEKLSGIHFEDGVPCYADERCQKAWNALVAANGEWLNVKQVANSAGVRRRKVEKAADKFMMNQVGGVRDGMLYVLVAREVPGHRFKRLHPKRCQLRLVPNTFQDVGWRSGRGKPVPTQRNGHPLFLPLQRPAAAGIA